MTVNELLFLVVIFLANIIEAMTGFAGTLLAMPASMMLIGLYEAKAILNIIALITCLTIVALNFQSINKRELLRILFFMLIGMFAGMALFESLSVDFLFNIYALVVIFIAGKNLFVKSQTAREPKYYHLLIVIIAGIIHGMFLSGGALLVIYALIVLRNKGEFRATIAAVWVVLDIILLVHQYRLGYVDHQVLTLTMYAFFPLVAAILLGNFLHKYVNQKTFFTITYILLLISGISLLVY